MLYDFLKEFAEKKCGCGKSHYTPVPKIVCENGAINRVPQFVKDLNAKKAFIIADKNTFKAAGEKLVSALDGAGIAHNVYVYREDRVFPDDKTMGRAIFHYAPDCDVIIAVGSGVMNDTGKIVSTVTQKPYIIVATAPSMDGFASATSSMEVDGFKVSLASRCADVIVGDTAVLKNAPLKTFQAGFGDMLAKYVSITEWRLGNEITGEYYCEEVAALVRTALKKCADNVKGLFAREESAVAAVFEGLVLSGIAMSFVGISRPASGVEHYFSHVWDMRGLQFGTKTELHGLQCGVATKIAAELYEKVLKLVPDEKKGIAYAESFNYPAWAERLKEFLGASAVTIIENEKKEGKYSVEKHKARIKTIIEKWDKICGIIRKEMPSAEKIGEMLSVIQAPQTPAELGIECDLALTFKATKSIRDKYVLSSLLWDLGELDTFSEYLK